jgi:colanic acid/amylovoran biosynthesis glycosyltransferase
VVPFFGDAEAGRALAARLLALRRRPGDELIVADNTPDGVFAALAPSGIHVARAVAERSSYHARNVGAARANGDWLLFLDADCVPPADLIDRYLEPSPAPDVTILAGSIVPASGQPGLLPEWAATREILSQERSVERDPPGAATANLMVRRAAWAGVGGFLEGVRSGADYEFCWRIGDRGGRLEPRPGAAVEHLHRTTLAGVARQLARYAAGNSWQRRRRPGSSPPPRAAAGLVRSAGGAAFFALTARPRRAALKLVDGVAAATQAWGRVLANTVAPRLERDRDRIVIATDRFPVPSETFIVSEIEALRALGHAVRVEAVARPDRSALGAAWGIDVRYLEDETALRRVRALAWLLLRHPLRALTDLRFRRRFDPRERMPLRAIAPLAQRLARGGDRHVHVHFAALAAVNALRAGRICGSPVSIIGHGHEVFATPRALPAKLAAAAFVAAPCEYTARHLAELMPPGSPPVEVVVMGVDSVRFRRRHPHPDGRTVVAVGRLVEKKGFADLIDAVAALPAADVEALLIAGDGPLRPALESRAAAAGIGGRVRLLGAVEPDRVRDLLEEASVFAMPCVVAADGDRDAMPVVVKEALGMEVPVAATDEVGLPEVVRPEWGRLASPRDPVALANALRELLSLPVADRARMGAAGREFVVSRFDTAGQARRLEALIAAAANRRKRC